MIIIYRVYLEDGGNISEIEKLEEKKILKLEEWMKINILRCKDIKNLRVIRVFNWMCLRDNEEYILSLEFRE